MENRNCNSRNYWISIAYHSQLEEEISKQYTKKKPLTTTKQQTKNWVTFSSNSPLKRKITNPFKHTNLYITLRATNTVHQQLTDKIVKVRTNVCGIYDLNVTLATISS